MRQILTLIPLIFFSACQINQQKPTTEIAQTPPTQVNSIDLIAEIERCQNNEVCLNELEAYLKTRIAPLAEMTQQDVNPLPEVAESQSLNLPIKQSSTSYQDPKLNNKRIQATLNEWLTWKRPQLIETWNNYQFLKAHVYPPFKQLDIPEALILAIITQESGGRVHSSSKAGAAGLFQFMPATARRFGVSGTIGDYDARYHPGKAAIGAAKYIEEQREAYGDEYAKILAAYNSGENRFKRLNKKHKNGDIWQNDFFYDLPGETQHYIATVLSAMMIFEAPEKFNVTLTEQDGQTALVRTNSATSLSELAVCFGQFNNDMGWYRILRNLNSSVKAKRVIKANTTVVIPQQLKDIYDNNCQSSELMSLAKVIHDADFPDRPQYTYYKIKQGDSLSSISKKFKCTNKKQIARLNKIKAPRYLINAGKRLKLPKC
mgnify:CR=1 FL=1